MGLVFKAAYLSGPYSLQVKETEISKIGDEQALVKVKAVGICGSDIECYLGKTKEGRYDLGPYTPGHEWSGEIVEVGKKVSFLKKGDKVTGDVVLSCGKCSSCKAGLPPTACEDFKEVGFWPTAPGGMADYLILEERFLHKFPDNLTFEEGALIEPFSVSYFAIWGDNRHVDASDDVAIFGAGPIGLFALVVAKVAGAKTIVIEPIGFRREMAEKLGADEVIDPSSQDVGDLVKKLTAGKGVNLIVEASGEDMAIAQCFDIATNAARIRLIGHSVGRKVPLEVGLTIWKGLYIHGQAGSPLFFPRTIKFLSRAKERIDFSQIITHRFPFEKIRDAFNLAVDEREKAVKVVLTM